MRRSLTPMARGCGGEPIAALPILILAAGASSRMRGRDKRRERIKGAPQLTRILEAATSVSDQVFVTLPSGGHWDDLIPNPQVRTIPVEAADQGLSVSLRAGLDAAPEDAEAVMICPADMVEIGRDAFRTMAQAWDPAGPAALRGCSGERQGHPVILARKLWPEIDQITGDQGAGKLLSGLGDDLRLIPLPGTQAITDLDTPEDWQAWRAARSE